MRLLPRLEYEQNTAQFGIFFSGNHLNSGRALLGRFPNLRYLGTDKGEQHHLSREPAPS
ncbi:MAG: hypothetical protein KJO08_00230 [Gammaproteobacteria bacterium]|nr:hypothetical protein [Gammaproteobacteria bacterium]